MIVVLAAALLLLTAAVVLLYAMMGELSSRLPAQDGDGETRISPLADYRQGSLAAEWPEGLARFERMPHAVVLVLSPVCNTCGKVAAELGKLPDGDLGDSVGVAISTGARETGEAFVAQHALGGLPHFVDEGGAWLTGNFNVNMSPAALVFKEGVLVEAYTFGSVQAIRNKVIGIPWEGAH